MGREEEEDEVSEEQKKTDAAITRQEEIELREPAEGREQKGLGRLLERTHVGTAQDKTREDGGGGERKRITAEADRRRVLPDLHVTTSSPESLSGLSWPHSPDASVKEKRRGRERERNATLYRVRARVKGHTRKVRVQELFKDCYERQSACDN